MLTCPCSSTMDARFLSGLSAKRSTGSEVARYRQGRTIDSRVGVGPGRMANSVQVARHIGCNRWQMNGSRREENPAVGETGAREWKALSEDYPGEILGSLRTWPALVHWFRKRAGS